MSHDGPLALVWLSVVWHKDSLFQRPFTCFERALACHCEKRSDEAIYQTIGKAAEISPEKGEHIAGYRVKLRMVLREEAEYEGTQQIRASSSSMDRRS